MKLFEKQKRLKLDDPNWSMDPELAVIDTILEEHPELYSPVRDDLANICKDNGIGRKDTPTVENVVRAAIYMEIKHLNYKELEYAVYDSNYSVKIPLELSIKKRDIHKYLLGLT